ncbi:hypothetical protein GOBAR_AA10315 [Gossypium barbadense]|uniref:Legume lectin domain-containing protein n=1 Tax=Gossypium barbadense TaxID=3634 RepID=A0A2P5Y3Z0_GOSBA|nr:hypothetical protein GOBAR_AA10315 [Gossypium barbadense]
MYGLWGFERLKLRMMVVMLLMLVLSLFEQNMSFSSPRIICYRAGGGFSSSPAVIPIAPNISYSAVAGGEPAFAHSGPAVTAFSVVFTRDELICATETNNTPPVTCWRTENSTEELPNDNLRMERQFGNFSMVNIEARGNHVNGVNSDGTFIYRALTNM